MSELRGKFDRKYKLQAVEMSFHRDNHKELAKDLGIRAELIYRWRVEFARYEGRSFPGNGKPKLTEEESEVVRLKRELEDVRIERDILKKAVGIFSMSDGRYFGS